MNKLVILIFLLFFCSTIVPAQKNVKKKKPTVTEVAAPPVQYITISELPSFYSGNGSLEQYMLQNLHYPDIARENNIQGRVVVRFMVNEDSTISNVSVIRGIGGGGDEEAIRLIKAMPKWRPGRLDGKRTQMFVVQPLDFKLK